jgi:hypothetical protein
LPQNGIKAEDVNWVKIDVEGAELEVLRGATNVLSKSENIALLIEVHGSHLYEPIREFIYDFDFHIDFEKSNEAGDWRHILARKQQQKKVT